MHSLESQEYKRSDLPIRRKAYHGVFIGVWCNRSTQQILNLSFLVRIQVLRLIFIKGYYMNYLEVFILGLVAIILCIQSIEIKALRRKMLSLESNVIGPDEKLSIVTSKVKASICYLQYLFKVKRNMLASERYEIIPQIQKGIESEAKCIGLNPKDVSEDSLYWVDVDDKDTSRDGADGSASGS